MSGTSSRRDTFPRRKGPTFTNFWELRSSCSLQNVTKKELNIQNYDHQNPTSPVTKSSVTSESARLPRNQTPSSHTPASAISRSFALRKEKTKGGAKNLLPPPPSPAQSSPPVCVPTLRMRKERRLGRKIRFSGL